MLLRRLFGNKQLLAVEALLKKAISNQEKLMAILSDLKVAVADIASDAMTAHDEVLAALDHILKEVDIEANPDLKAALDSLHASHEVFVDSLKTLKDKVDSVSASGGSV